MTGKSQPSDKRWYEFQEYISLNWCFDTEEKIIKDYSQICDYQLSPDEKNTIFLQSFLAKIFMDSLAGQFIVMFDMIDISRKSNA